MLVINRYNDYDNFHSKRKWALLCSILERFLPVSVKPRDHRHRLVFAIQIPKVLHLKWFLVAFPGELLEPKVGEDGQERSTLFRTWILLNKRKRYNNKKLTLTKLTYFWFSLALHVLRFDIGEAVDEEHDDDQRVIDHIPDECVFFIWAHLRSPKLNLKFSYPSERLRIVTPSEMELILLA